MSTQRANLLTSDMPVLHEYQSFDLDLSRAQAEALQRTRFVEVVPAVGDRWRVTASSYVGALVVEGVELVIRPKIRPENLFLLLEPGLPPSAWRREDFDYEISPNLLASVIAFFSRTVETTLARGVLRSYRSRQESLVALRGRLDVVGQFNRAGVMTPVACTYDDFTEDIDENRLLRAAVSLSLRVPGVHIRDRQRLMRQLVALEDVAEIAARPDDFDQIQFTRLNEHYAPALGLARLIVANLSLVDTRGETTAASFMVDMNDLFQRFVTQRLRRELRGILDVVDEPVVHLGEGQKVPMQPDLVFQAPAGRPAYVGDVKYKLASGAKGRSSDYYQLLAYTTAMNLPEGVLIYCRHPEDSVESAVSVRHTGKRLALRSIDLSGSAEQIEEEVRALASFIASRPHTPAERLGRALA